MSSQIKPHDVVGAIFVPKLMSGATKGPDVKTVTQALDLPEGGKMEEI